MLRGAKTIRSNSFAPYVEDVATVKEKVTNVEHQVIKLRISDAKYADSDIRLEHIGKLKE